MGLEENKAVSNRSAELISQHDIAGLEEVISPSILEGIKPFLADLLAAFPDFRLENIERIAEGNKVVSRDVGRGTHQGEFMGVPPTGKQVTFNGIAIDTIVDGKIAGNVIVIDWLSVLQQIGATSVPAPTTV